jgi:predicted RNA-binding protein with PUA-like domain
MPRRYWLFKSEPNVFSIDDLEKSPKKTTMWEGVRNYQARNMLRDDVKKGDGVLFYHSSVEPMAVAGTATVVKEGYPDPTQFQKSAKYYDPNSAKDNPRWFLVDIKFDQKFGRPVTLAEVKEAKGLEKMVLIKKGSRLSIQPVTAAEWRIVRRLGSK